MKSKLTITVDADLIPAAKRFARSQGVTLSSLVEKALREATEKPEPSFSERWRKKLADAPRIDPPKPGEDPRFDHLARKHLS